MQKVWNLPTQDIYAFISININLCPILNYVLHLCEGEQYLSCMAGIWFLSILKIVLLLTNYAPSEGRFHGSKQQLLNGRNLVMNATVSWKEDEVSAQRSLV